MGRYATEQMSPLLKNEKRFFATEIEYLLPDHGSMPTCACQHDRNYNSSTHGVSSSACFRLYWTRCVHLIEAVADVADFSSSYSADGAGHTSPGAAAFGSDFGWVSSDTVDAVLSDASAMLR